MRAFVTQRQILDSHGEPADELLHGMASFISARGFAPVPVPNDIGAACKLLDEVPFDLLVLSGGGFVPGAYYEHECEGAGSQPVRDAVEAMLLGHAMAAGIPVLGICRGMHYLNGYLGGKTRRFGSAFPPREDHEVVLRDGSRIVVNSFHDDAVPLGSAATGVDVLAVEETAQTVEAFRTPDRKVLGLQWHPERPLGDEGAVRATEELLEDLLGDLLG